MTRAQAWRRLLALVVCLALYLAAAFITALLIRLLRRNDCPADSFLWHMTQDTLLVAPLPLTAVLIGGAALITGYMPQTLASWGNPRAYVASAIALAALVMPFGIWLALGNELCLTPSQILIRDNTLARLRRYAWSNVTGLQTVCETRGLRRRHKVTGAHFFLANGDGFWIGTAGYANAFPELQSALTGIHYHFDSSAMDGTCSAGELAALSRAP